MNGWLRLLESQGGFVATLESVPIRRGAWDTVWCTQAKLTAPFAARMAGIQDVPTLVHAWAEDKGDSQRAALEAAVVTVMAHRSTVGESSAGHVGWAAAHTSADGHAGEAVDTRARLRAYGAWISARVARSKPIALRQLAWKVPKWLRPLAAWRAYAAWVAGDAHYVIVTARDALGLYVGCACDHDARSARFRATCAAYRRMMRVGQVCAGDEPLLDTVDEQRLWAYPTDAHLADAALERLDMLSTACTPTQAPIAATVTTHTQGLPPGWLARRYLIDDASALSDPAGAVSDAAIGADIDALYFWETAA